MEIMLPWRNFRAPESYEKRWLRMELVVIGEGGHSKVIQDLIRFNKDFKIIAILDDKHKELKLEHDVFRGPVSSAQNFYIKNINIKFFVAIGNNEIRKAIVSKLGLPQESYITLIHQTAVVSPTATIGYGSVIMANAVISSDAIVGNHAIVNTGAIIEHDNVIEDYVHAAPKATLTGSVKVLEGAMIGAGATVIPGKCIGEWAVIGAGSTVIRDIPARCTAVGAPAKIINGKVVI